MAKKLEERIRDILPLHNKILEPVEQNISLYVQSSFMNGTGLSGTKRAIILGNFYENLHRAIYGGKLNDMKHGPGVNNDNIDSCAVKPDIVGLEQGFGIFSEVKSCVMRHSCNMTDSQFEGYKFIQYNHPQAKIRVPIYRHSLKGIKSKPTEHLSEEEIVKELLSRTLFSIILPFRVIMKLREIPFSNGINHARNYKGKEGGFPNCLVINSITIDGLFFNPEEIFEHLGLDFTEFDVKRYLLSDKLKVNNHLVKPFPIIKIFDRNHTEWLRHFREGYGRRRDLDELIERAFLEDTFFDSRFSDFEISQVKDGINYPSSEKEEGDLF